MAGLKEIQMRMRSVQDTMKITNAMYMISSSKMKRAKQVLLDAEPYYYGIQSAIARIMRHIPEGENRYLDPRSDISPEDRKIALIVVTADKGLSGAYTHNIVKMAEEQLKKPGHIKLYVLGVVGQQFFSKKNVNMDSSFRYTVQKPTMHRARMISETIIGGFLSKELDEVRILYTEMINSLSTEPKLVDLLPLHRSQFTAATLPLDARREEVLMIPSENEVLNNIVPNYLTGLIYGSLVESYCSENSARMLAMQSATDNAKKMLKELSLQYNRARQAAITQEITEVISGANALKRKG